MHNFNLFSIFNIFTEDLHYTSLEYVLSIQPLRFSPRQWNTILLFVGVKFSFMNIPCDLPRPIDVLSMFFKPFLLTRAFSACFLLTNCTIVLSEFFYFPIRWQTSISLIDTFTSILYKFQLFLFKVLIINIIWNPSDFKVFPSTILL